MIAFAKSCSNDSTTHAKFLAILPAIRRQSELAFRTENPEAKEELIAEVIANAFSAFVRLIQRGKENVALPTPLAKFAIRQVRAGRRVGSRLNVRDAMSPANRRVVVENLNRFNPGTGEWQEILVEDKHAGPAETAAARIDVAAWFRSLGRQKRRIARMLSRGETTSDVARTAGLSLGRISQLRRELQQSWQAVHGELKAA